MTTKLNTKLDRLVLFLMAFFTVVFTTNVSAVNETRRQMFAENNIVFYDPEGNGNPCGPGSNGTIDPTPGSTNGTLAEVVRQYGELAMELQREYGTPWEVVFAQMLHESGVGTAGIAVGVANNGYYNWLGITGTGGSLSVGEPYVSSNGRKWAQYPSIENMIKAWAGTYIARNGYYDAAFAYTDPNNFNLESFLNAFINVYAPPSDGNDVTGYVSAVLSTINGTIATVRAEKGWPSSAELAKNENIPIGGRHPIGGGGGGGSDDGPSTIPCDPTVGAPGELISGGMTLEQAEAFLAPYIAEASKKKSGHYGAGYANGNVIGDGWVNDASCKDHTLNNCVALSQWFVNNYTTAGPGVSSTNGNKYVGYLLGLNKGFVDGGTTPRTYAIGSNQTYNHTFIVLGVDAEHDKMIIGEASCGNGYVSSGYRWPAAREVSIQTFSTNTGAIYAYTDNILKGIGNSE